MADETQDNTNDDAQNEEMDVAKQAGNSPAATTGDVTPPSEKTGLMARIRSEVSDTLAPVAGFGVTFKTMFAKVATEEYPEKPRPTQPRFHGRHQLNRHADGLEKCVGCELCAWACPADAILVEGADNTDAARFSPGERYGRVYQINYLRCIFCGLCIEACPTRALTMTNDYEIADRERAPLIYEKHQLLAPLREGMLPPPFPMADGMEERDYYLGQVTAPTQSQKDYVGDRDRAAQQVANDDDAESSQEVYR